MLSYPSKISKAILLPPILIIGGMGVLMAYEKIWVGLGLMLFFLVFISYLITSTYYQVSATILFIRCGFFFKRRIEIDSIRQIRETRNPISSPALSLDRLEIAYKKYDTVLISPREKEKFIAHLTRINPGIEVIAKDIAKE
jgi:hypothetical protein